MVVISIREEYYGKFGMRQLCEYNMRDQFKKRADVPPSMKLKLEFFSKHYCVFRVGSLTDEKNFLEV